MPFRRLLFYTRFFFEMIKICYKMLPFEPLKNNKMIIDYTYRESIIPDTNDYLVLT